MQKLNVILCESGDRWATALRRHVPQNIRVQETRTVSDLFERMAEQPDSVAVIEMTSGREQAAIDALVRLGREFPSSQAVVVAERQCEAWEPLAREAGAIHFVASPRRLQEVGAILRRAANNRPGSDEDAGLTLEDQILADLPWSE